MKKLLILLVLAALLIGTVGACGNRDSDLDIRDYRALMGELAVLAEYHFFGDVTIQPGHLFWNADMWNELFAEEMPTRFRTRGTVSRANREMFVSYVHETAQNVHVFDLDMILQEQMMYVGLSAALEYMLPPLLESFGREVGGFRAADILDDDMYLRIPHGRELGDMLFAPRGTGNEFDLERFLTRDGERFTVRLQDEDVRPVVDDMSQMLDQFAVQGGFVGGNTHHIFADVSSRLTNADLRDARALMITSRSGNVFYQTIELQVGDLLDMRANFTFIAETIDPIDTPANTLRSDELTALLLDLDWNELFPEIAHTEEPDEEAYWMREDLTGLDLINPTLSEPSHLERIEIGTAQAGEVLDTVAIIRGAQIRRGEFHLTATTDPIVMMYTLLDGRDATQTVLSAVVYDQMGTFLSDSQIRESALRTNEARSMAAMAVMEETAAGNARLYVYLAQSIDQDTIIRLELLFDLDLFTDETYEIMTELSQQFGINVGAYIPGLLSTIDSQST